MEFYFILPPEDIVEARIQVNLILFEVLKQFVRAEDFGDAHQLIVIVVSVEEGLLAEYHAGHHAAQTPHVQGIVVHLIVHQQLRALEVARRHAHIVLLARVVEFRQAPIDQTQLRWRKNKDALIHN